MKLTIPAFLLAFGVGMLPAPQPADARVTWGCVIDAVSTCDRDFPSGDRFNAAIRGWCYLIRSALC
jgi:hypothetical protein